MSNLRLKGGGRLAVQEASPGDAAEILQFLGIASGESNYLASTPEDFKMTVDQEREYLQNQAAAAHSVTLAGKVEKRVVAIGSLATPRQARCAHTSEVSLLVSRVYWGQGVGAAMLESLLQYARQDGTLRLLHLGAREDNLRALGLYRRFGFEVAGRLKHFFYVDGRYYDQILMELLL